jgi:outer membrane protein assembly factor BamB
MTREKAPVTSWSLDGKNVHWKTPIEGRTTPILLNGRLYAIVTAGDVNNLVSVQERIVCLDAETGKLLWEKRFNVFDTDIVQQRLGWTAMVGDPQTGYVYAHLTGGEFVCLDRDGKVVWKHSLTEEFGRVSGYGGRIHFPILDEDRVIIGMFTSGWGDQGKPLHRLLAADKKTGEILWWAGPGEAPIDTTYAVPVVAVIDGKRMLIMANGDGNVYGLLARTGEKLWTFKLSKRGLNASPVVDGNYVYVTNGEENLDTTEMGRVVCIDATKTGDITTSGEVWRAEGIKAGFASPALANGRLYVADNSANLFAIDAKTGKIHWQYSTGRVAKGSPTVTSDGIIYYGEQNGAFHVLKDAGDHCESLDLEEFARDDKMIDEIYGSPIVANGRVYFMTRYNMYCLGGKEKTPDVPIQSGPKENPTLGQLTRLLVVPAEVSLAPGVSQKFEVRGFDAIGHALPSNPDWAKQLAWTSSGVIGTTSPDGTLTVSGDNVFSAGAVTAKMGELTAAARVRVAPPLPIKESFDAMPPDSAPPGWIGVGGGKTKIEEKDGSRVLRKVGSKEKPSPPFMRVRGYVSPPIEGGYTIETDILGTPRGERFRPDMGVINTRYFMTLMGNNQLWIESWSTMPRLHHEIPFIWETNKWYRMKLRVDTSEKEAKIRGKVWPRGEAEPSAWTVDVVDPFPNLEGSPGLYAYSNGTTPKSDGPEVFYDNLQVTKNE